MYIRTVSRAIARSSPSVARASPMGCLNTHRLPVQQQQTRAASEHAIANPTLVGIEKRWEGMPPQEQAELWMQLRDRMKVDWKELTLQEKKAAYWISFGNHGPRAEEPKGEGWRITTKVTQLLIVSVVLFGITRLFAKQPPRTMTKEWQEASNEYAKREKINPISGISSVGYEGKGFVQSPPATKS